MQTQESSVTAPKFYAGCDKSNAAIKFPELHFANEGGQTHKGRLQLPSAVDTTAESSPTL